MRASSAGGIAFFWSTCQPSALRSSSPRSVMPSRTSSLCGTSRILPCDAAEILLLGGGHAAARVEALAEAPQHDLEGDQETEDVRGVVVAQMRDAQDLSLQL